MNRHQQAVAMRNKLAKRVLDYAIEHRSTSEKQRGICMAMLYGSSPFLAYRNAKRLEAEART